MLNLCIETCDPTDDPGVCDADEVCIPSPNTQSFVCVFGIDAIGPGEACEFVNVCAPGLGCVEAGAVEGCDAMAQGCCSPFCDVDSPEACDLLPGNVCVPWFEIPVMGYEHVGVCVAP